MTTGRMTVEEYTARYEYLLYETDIFNQYRGRAPYWVYRYYNDTAEENHRLLYIGVTKEFNTRDYFHSWRSLWHSVYPITRVEIEEFPNQREAEAAETAAIRAERPCHNSKDNWGWSDTHEMGECDPYAVLMQRTPGTKAERASLDIVLGRISPSI